MPIPNMAFARTILALLIAASVALLPAAGAAASGLAALGLQSQDQAEMTASDPMHECCPPAANPSDKCMDCASMTTCALKCFSYTAGPSSPLAYSVTLADRMPLPQGVGFRSQTSSPPFRPPRV